MDETPITTTRSGRSVRRVVRYEPDPDTVFEDDTNYSDSSCDIESEEELSEPSSESESEISSDEDSDDDDEEEEVETVAEDDQYLEDALDWDRLTENAGSEADAESESEMTDYDEE